MRPGHGRLTSGAVVVLRRGRIFAKHTASQLIRVASVPKDTGLHCQNARTHHREISDSVLFFFFF